MEKHYEILVSGETYAENSLPPLPNRADLDKKIKKIVKKLQVDHTLKTAVPGEKTEAFFSTLPPEDADFIKWYSLVDILKAIVDLLVPQEPPEDD